VNVIAPRSERLRPGSGAKRRKPWLLVICLLAVVPAGLTLGAQQTGIISGVAAPAQSEIASGLAVLLPTRHPPLPQELSKVWMVPARSSGSRSAANAPLGTAATLMSRREYSKALTVLSQSSAREGVLADYASYYAGLAHLELLHADDALRTFKALRERKPLGYLAEASGLGVARAYEALNDPAAAVAVYEELLQEKLVRPEDVYMRLGLAARVAHERNKAADAFGRVYYEFALTERAPEAAAQLALLHLEPAPSGSQRYQLDLGRAERLYGAKQYADAHEAYESLRSRATDEDRPLIQLRLAECDYYLKRPRNARDALKPFVDGSFRRAEALYHFALVSRDLGDAPGFLRLSRRVVDEFPHEPWAEASLNALASYYLKRDEDDLADAAFRELLERNSKSAYGERAAWKAGWRSYRQGKFEETVRFFDRASYDFPRSDFRPGWLYWSGRAYDRLNAKPIAEERYLLAVADYLNSYYGRLAASRLDRDAPTRAVAIASGLSGDITLPADLPPNGPIVRALLEAGLLDAATDELKYAQRLWGDSPAIQATLAWISQQQSVTKNGMEQLMLFRGGITQMRRAYPQFLTASGENLPREILTTIFPLNYWELIRTHSTANGLDPFLVASLVLQESTFVPDVRSPANAFGLMQLLPANGRYYARKLNLRYSPSLLTRPESNIRMGTALFADALRDFRGASYLALASYNAGPRPVRRWMAERPGIDVDEFIDDIPYPETQNYVKRILGQADDYRHLYASLMKSQ
jgi:soluble lytic murein transglycosylase